MMARCGCADDAGRLELDDEPELRAPGLWHLVVVRAVRGACMAVGRGCRPVTCLRLL
jgi:hypothetical protein